MIANFRFFICVELVSFKNLEVLNSLWEVLLPVHLPKLLHETPIAALKSYAM